MSRDVSPAPAALSRTLGTGAVAILIVGGVIGSGIFLVPSLVLQQTGGAFGLALGVWAVAGILVLLGALSYAELTAMQPGSGGLYLYLRDAYGRLPAFLYGWTLFLVIGGGAAAALAVASAAYLQQLIPMGTAGQAAASLGFLALLVTINTLSTRGSVRLVGIAMVIKVGVIALLVGIAPIRGTGFSRLGPLWPASWSIGTVLTAAGAMVSVLWSFEGWQFSTFMSGEVVEPQRSLPRGLAVGTLALVVIYLAANLAYAAALGGPAMATSERVAADAVAALLGPGPAALVALAIMLAMMSAAQVILLTSARVFYAMAQDGLFFASLARIHPRYGTPAVSIVAMGAWAGVLAMTGTFEALLTYVIFVGWIFWALAALTVVVFRRTRPEAPRPYRVPGYPIPPILFAVVSFTIVLNTVLTHPRQGLAGLGILALGVPAYLYWTMANRA